MSYDIRISVKVEGCRKYAEVGFPEYSSPTFNLRDMLVACMDWEYHQVEQYPAVLALEKIEHGINELEKNRDYYKRLNPSNGWGNIDSALRALKSSWKCIHECAEEYPIGCLYFEW